MKTLLKAKHSGQHTNSVGGCYTRWANDGYCCGVKWAEWLNSLGDDKETYLTIRGYVVTNLEVRENWLYHSDHLSLAEIEGGAK